MQKFIIKKNSISRILMIDIYDSSSSVGARLAGLAYNSAGLTAYFNREGAAGVATSITLVTATKGTYSSGGFVAIDATNMPGHYELHIPDAAIAAGANSVFVELKGATNMVPKTFMIELVDNIEADTYAIVNNTTYGNSALNTNINTLLTRIPAEVLQKNHLIVRTGTAQGGAATTITLDSGASATDNYYNELWVLVNGGTGAGQVRAIIAYAGATKIATITPNWITVPDGTSTFVLIAVSRNDAISSGTTDWSAAEKNQIRQALGVDGTKAATSSGNVDTLLARVPAEVAQKAHLTNGTGNISPPLNTGLWDRIDVATSSRLAAGNVTVGGYIAGQDPGAFILVTPANKLATDATNRVTVGTNADKSGYSLSTAGVQAIWDALTSALLTVGSIGKLLADNINATISSRSSHTAADVWAAGTRTLTSFGTLVSDIWNNSTRTLTAFSTSLAVSIWDVLESAILTASSIGIKIKTNLDVAISSRLASSGYTAPDNTGIGNIYNIVNHATYGNSALNIDLDTLLTRVPSEVAQKTHLVNGTGNITPPLNTGLWDRVDTTISSRANGTDYTAARAAKIDNLDATISSRSPETGGNVAAIKAKTDTITWQDITDCLDEVIGKWSINKTTNILTIYRRDGVTVLKTFNLTDNASVSERVPI